MTPYYRALVELDAALARTIRLAGPGWQATFADVATRAGTIDARHDAGELSDDDAAGALDALRVDLRPAAALL